MSRPVEGMTLRPLGAASTTEPASAAGTAACAPKTPADRARLAAAAQSFEALFLTQLLKSVHPDGGLLSTDEEAGAGSDLMREMTDEQLALVLARHGGIGLGAMLARDLARAQARGATGTETAGTPAAPPAGKKVDEP